MSQSPSSGPSGTSDPFSAPSSPAEQPLEAGVVAPYGAYQAGYQAGYPGAAPRYGMPGLPPVVKSMKAPWILLASGVTMMVLAIVGIALTIGAFLNATSLQPLDSNGTTTVTLEGGKEYGLFGDGYANCDYTGPGTIEEGSVTGDVTVNDKSELLTLTPSASGEYTFDCHSSARALALGDAASVSGIVTGAGAFLGSLFLGGAGTIVLIIGIVWAVRRRSSNRKAQAFLDSQAPGGMTA